jgi:hypothetical protein
MANLLLYDSYHDGAGNFIDPNFQDLITNKANAAVSALPQADSKNNVVSALPQTEPKNNVVASALPQSGPKAYDQQNFINSLNPNVLTSYANTVPLFKDGETIDISKMPPGLAHDLSYSYTSGGADPRPIAGYSSYLDFLQNDPNQIERRADHYGTTRDPALSGYSPLVQDIYAFNHGKGGVNEMGARGVKDEEIKKFLADPNLKHEKWQDIADEYINYLPENERPFYGMSQEEIKFANQSQDVFANLSAFLKSGDVNGFNNYMNYAKENNLPMYVIEDLLSGSNVSITPEFLDRLRKKGFKFNTFEDQARMAHEDALRDALRNAG